MARQHVEKNVSGKPRPEPEDIEDKQDPDYSEADFELALDRVTRRLVEPAEPDPGSPRR